MGKKLIRVKISSDLLNGYNAKLGDGSLFFAFAKDKKGKTKDNLRLRQQTSGFTTCREFLCDVPRSVANDQGGDEHIDVDFGRLRLLVGVSGGDSSFDKVKEKLFSGKRALNLLENEAGWQPSVITTVKHEQYEKDHVWMLTGDSKWMLAPQMISLAGLIMRLGYNFNLRTDSLKDLMKHFSEIASGKHTNSTTSDQNYITRSKDHIIDLMKNVDKVFHEEKLIYYPDREIHDWPGYGGIDTLMNGNSGIESLTNSFNKFVLGISEKQHKTAKEK